MTHEESDGLVPCTDATGRVVAYMPGTPSDPSVITGKHGYLEVHLHQSGRVRLKGLGGELELGHRDNIHPLVLAIIGAEIEPLPRSRRRKLWRWLGWLSS